MHKSNLGVQFTDRSIDGLPNIRRELERRNCKFIVITIAWLGAEYEIGLGLDHHFASGAIIDKIGMYEVAYYTSDAHFYDIRDNYILDITGTEKSMAIIKEL